MGYATLSNPFIKIDISDIPFISIPGTTPIKGLKFIRNKLCSHCKGSGSLPVEVDGKHLRLRCEVCRGDGYLKIGD